MQNEIQLVWGWPENIRRNSIGLNEIKAKIADNKQGDEPYSMNIFLFAFLCSAKNLDLFLTADVGKVRGQFVKLLNNLDCLENFERTGVSRPEEQNLISKWLEVRGVAARASARDEQRTLATLLFSGPSTSQEVADDLGISPNLAERVMRALESVLASGTPQNGKYQLSTEAEAISVSLYLLRLTLGIDPTTALASRFSALQAVGVTNGGQ